MATAASTSFFNPTSPFGDLTGWEIQTSNPTTGNTRAQALGADGDEIASQTHDAKTTATATYTATATTAAIPKAGNVVNGWHIDSVQVVWNNTAFAQMTLTGHKHGNSSTHTRTGGTPPRKYTGSLATVGTLFGCPSAPLGVVIPTGAGVRTVTYNLTVNHIDELGSDGNWLDGNNYDGTETVDVELCDSGTIEAADGWDLTSVGNNEGNTAAETASATVEKHLAHD